MPACVPRVGGASVCIPGPFCEWVWWGGLGAVHMGGVPSGRWPSPHTLPGHAARVWAGALSAFTDSGGQRCVPLPAAGCLPYRTATKLMQKSLRHPRHWSLRKQAGWAELSHFRDREMEACSCTSSFTGAPRPERYLRSYLGSYFPGLSLLPHLSKAGECPPQGETYQQGVKLCFSLFFSSES